jgi:hypothetical protein
VRAEGIGRSTRRAAGLVLATVVLATSSASGQTKNHPVNFSFFYPLSTNRTPDVSTRFRLGILYGRLAEVHGVDLSAVVARTDRDFGGLQLAGAVATTGGAFRGIALTGGVQVVGGPARGIQAAGGVNFARDRFRGGQVAGIFNFAGGDFTGLQLTSVYNLCDADVRGLQLASIANVAGGQMTGWQLAGINVANDSLSGVQSGLANFSAQVHGAQLGLANFAGSARGAMIGFWNQARRVDGMMIGAVNLASENGTRGWVGYGSTYALANAGFVSGVGPWYSMLAVGVNDLDDERGDTVVLAWHYGRAFAIRAPWQVDADLGFVHAIPQPSDDPSVNDRLHFAAQARLLVDRSVGESWRLFAGGGLNVVWSEYSSDADPEAGPLAVLGLWFE